MPSPEAAKGEGMARPPYWLVARRESDRMDVLTMELDGGEEVLPVFSSEEEADTFLRPGTSKDGWQVRETTSGELVSVLFGPCAGVGRVALDPPPEVRLRPTIELVSVDRDGFVDRLVDEGRTTAR
jgi:hypothetical protein